MCKKRSGFVDQDDIHKGSNDNDNKVNNLRIIKDNQIKKSNRVQSAGAGLYNYSSCKPLLEDSTNPLFESPHVQFFEESVNLLENIDSDKAKKFKDQSKFQRSQGPNSFQNLQDHVKTFNPRLSIKTFKDLQNKNDYIDILNNTVEKMIIGGITNKVSIEEIKPDRIFNIHLKHEETVYYCINVTQKKSPFIGNFSLKDVQLEDYIVYFGYDIIYPSLKYGFDKQFKNVKKVSIEEEHKSKIFHRSYVYFGFYSECNAILQIKFTFPGPDQKLVINPFITKRRGKNNTKPVTIKDAMDINIQNDDIMELFIEENKKFFGVMTKEEKMIHCKKILENRLETNHANYIKMNSADIGQSVEMKLKKIAMQDQQYNDRQVNTLINKKELSDNKKENLFYKIEKNDVQRRLIKELVRNYENKYRIAHLQKNWIQMIYKAQFGQFIKKFQQSMRSQIKDLLDTAVAHRYIITTYRKKLCGGKNNISQRLAAECKYVLHFSAINFFEKVDKKAFENVAAFLPEFSLKKNLLAKFQRIRIIINKFEKRFIRFKKHSDIFQKKLINKFPKAYSEFQHANRNNQVVPEDKTPQELKDLIEQFFDKKKSDHSIEFKKWYSSNMKGTSYKRLHTDFDIFKKREQVPMCFNVSIHELNEFFQIIFKGQINSIHSEILITAVTPVKPKEKSRKGIQLSKTLNKNESAGNVQTKTIRGPLKRSFTKLEISKNEEGGSGDKKHAGIITNLRSKKFLSKKNI